MKLKTRKMTEELNFLISSDSNMLLEEVSGLKSLTKALNTYLIYVRKEKEKTREKEQLISDIYTNLAHDIRTPLTSLRGYFQLLETCRDDSKRKQYMEIIESRIFVLQDMLEELFTYTKLKNDAYSIKLEPCCLNKILKDLILSFYEEWSIRGITPNIEITDEIVMFRGNRAGIERAISNILKNAAEHGEEYIDIKLTRKENIVLEVANKITNYENIDVALVFERFYKADSARNKMSTGLGLAIAKEFINRMGGEISASIRDEKFIVRIVLPEYDD